jgi:hypothetical protein
MHITLRRGTMNTQRPLSVTSAAVLLALFSVLNMMLPLFPTEEIPAFIVYSRIVLGVIGFVARYGLRALLLSAPDLEVVDEAGDRDKAVSLVDRLQPNVILMELNMSE